MARVNRFGFLAIALAFHLVYIYSIFDIYFVSPIVSGMREFGVERAEGVEAPAKRLVLFVGNKREALLHIIDPVADSLNLQVTDFERIKLSNPSQSHTPKMRQIWSPDPLRPSCDRASSSMEPSECRILESLQNQDRDMWHLLQVSTRMCLP
jgi:hypothetical protein